MGHEEVVRLLLEKNAEVNLQIDNYGNPLQNPCARKHEAVVRLLVEMGANVNICIARFGSAPHQNPSFASLQRRVRMLTNRGEHFELKPNAASAKSSQGSGSHSKGG
ncbi:hypothetical protein B0H14DRAFT_2346512 [Mycena olivaceomarginata]|nr:hypothetical protein B0H14DRAFT_2346512 [Mycena olivaceomarginata]